MTTAPLRHEAVGAQPGKVVILTALPGLFSDTIGMLVRDVVSPAAIPFVYS
jgi:hypothetical protein